MRRMGTVLLSLVLVSSACGDADSSGSTTDSGNGSGDLTAEETAAVAKLERGYPDWVDSDAPADPAEAHCWAVGMVTDFGIENLQKYGVVDADLEFDQASSEPMSAADAALFVDIEFRCESFEARVQELIRGDSRADMSDAEMKECVQAVTEEDVRQGFEGFLREDAEPVEALFEKLRRAGCGDFYGG